MIFERTFQRLHAFAGSSRKGIADVLVSLVPQATKSLLGFLSSILLARGLGPAGMGQYALVQSVTDAVTSLTDPGVSQTAIRYASIAAARGDADGQLAVVRWAFRLRLLALLALGLLLVVAIPAIAEGLWHSGELTPLLRIGLVTAAFLSLGAVPAVYFQSSQRFGMNAALLTAQGIVAFVGIALLAWGGLLTVERVVLVGVAAAGVAALLSAAALPRAALVPARTTPAGPFRLRSLWSVPPSARAQEGGLEPGRPEEFALYLLLSTVIVLVTMRLDLWLMGIYLEQSQIGLYNIASRTALPLMFVLTALGTALWPRASAVGSVAEVQALLRKTLRVSVLVSLAGALYAIVVPLLIPLLFGAAYAPSVLLSQIISLGYCIAIMANPMSMVGYSFGMARIYWIVNLVQLAVVASLLLLLLPRLGVLGAAFTFVANNLVGGLLNGYLVYRKSRAFAAAPGGAA